MIIINLKPKLNKADDEKYDVSCTCTLTTSGSLIRGYKFSYPTSNLTHLQPNLHKQLYCRSSTAPTWPAKVAPQRLPNMPVNSAEKQLCTYATSSTNIYICTHFKAGAPLNFLPAIGTVLSLSTT